MKYLSLFLILFLSSFSGACSHSKKVNQEQSSTSMTPDAPIPYAPGSAQISAEIVSLDLVNQGYSCVLRVQAVHGYGSSTPPLPEGSEITALVSESLLESTAPGKQAIEVLPPGEIKNLTLSYRQTPALEGAASAPSWRIVSIR